MKLITRFKFFLWYFGHFKVPLIGHLKPKLISLDSRKIVIMLPLNQRSKNHFNTMYFGALAVGADLACGFHGFYHAEQEKVKISLAFKSFRAQFLKRPESDVYFISEMGEQVKEMLDESKAGNSRVNRMIKVNAYINYLKNPELVAEFELELSIKVL
ncbi:hypothetical protein ACFORL_06135 [Legionella dresdenensis]|uniref:Aromatic compounds catabolism n=1 Tax=Legionella dresdenensis TaxID=450200 RepID=A0ABV8CEQ9_9GAMM